MCVSVIYIYTWPFFYLFSALGCLNFARQLQCYCPVYISTYIRNKKWLSCIAVMMGVLRWRHDLRSEAGQQQQRSANAERNSHNHTLPKLLSQVRTRTRRFFFSLLRLLYVYTLANVHVSHRRLFFLSRAESMSGDLGCADVIFNYMISSLLQSLERESPLFIHTRTCTSVNKCNFLPFYSIYMCVFIFRVCADDDVYAHFHRRAFVFN